MVRKRADEGKSKIRSVHMKALVGFDTFRAVARGIERLESEGA